MWPWEHVFVAYLAYSLCCHALFRDSPGGAEALAAASGALLPDAVDKLLAWQFDVFASGYAVAHSVFVAVPASVIAGLLAHRYGHGRVGLALGVGYLLHLVGDVIPVSLERGTLMYDHLLWPVIVYKDYHQHEAFTEGFFYYVVPYVSSLLEAEPTPYLFAQAGVGAAVLLLWAFDGFPGPGALVAVFRRTLTGFRRVLAPVRR